MLVGAGFSDCLGRRDDSGMAWRTLQSDLDFYINE